MLILGGEEVGKLFGHCTTGFKVFKGAPAKAGLKLLYRLLEFVRITVRYFHTLVMCINLILQFHHHVSKRVSLVPSATYTSSRGTWLLPLLWLVSVRAIAAVGRALLVCKAENVAWLGLACVWPAGSS